MGEITHDEAATIALKFINQHFNNSGKERPRASIPADPKRDDDLRLMEYIRQQRAASMQVVEVILTHPAESKHTSWVVVDNDHAHLKPGQSLAIIERHAEAAAGEGKK